MQVRHTGQQPDQHLQGLPRHDRGSAIWDQLKECLLVCVGDFTQLLRHQIKQSIPAGTETLRAGTET